MLAPVSSTCSVAASALEVTISRVTEVKLVRVGRKPTLTTQLARVPPGAAAVGGSAPASGVPTHVLEMTWKSPGDSSRRALPPVASATPVMVSGASPALVITTCLTFSAAGEPAATPSQRTGLALTVPTTCGPTPLRFVSEMSASVHRAAVLLLVVILHPADGGGEDRPEVAEVSSPVPNGAGCRWRSRRR